MKYFLAFDMREPKESNRRYIVIPNKLIRNNLDFNNNLEALCNYTANFYDERELKDVIIELIPDYSIYQSGKLVIAWNRKIDGVDYIHSNKVPYKKHRDYFNFENLVRFMVNSCYDPTFLEALFEKYRTHDYLSRELNLLYAACNSQRPTYSVDTLVRKFLRKVLYGKGTLEYAKLYKMIMFITGVTQGEMQYTEGSLVENARRCKEDSSEHCLLTDVQQFEQEWLEDRARLRSLGQW